MTGLIFGTGGVPHSASKDTTVSGIERIAELGLGCMEMEFVMGVKMGENEARLVAKTASEKDIKLSVHAPYFINLNAHEPEKVKASQERLLKSTRVAALCGAQSVVVHTAFYLGDPANEAYKKVKNNIAEVLFQLKQENNNVLIRPEVMGKQTQFGTIEEIINLCNELDGLAPCIDFAHWHARTGVYNSYPEFISILRQIEEGLGRAALDDIHIHFSGIKYGEKGELKHLIVKDSDFNYIELLRALKEYQVKGLLICESPNLEEDALLLQETYNSLVL